MYECKCKFCLFCFSLSPINKVMMIMVICHVNSLAEGNYCNSTRFILFILFFIYSHSGWMQIVYSHHFIISNTYQCLFALTIIWYKFFLSFSNEINSRNFSNLSLQFCCCYIQLFSHFIWKKKSQIQTLIFFHFIRK